MDEFGGWDERIRRTLAARGDDIDAVLPWYPPVAGVLAHRRRWIAAVAAAAAVAAVAVGVLVSSGAAPRSAPPAATGRPSISSTATASASSSSALVLPKAHPPDCSQAPAPPVPGAATTLGLNAKGIPAPLWSARTGYFETVDSGRIYAVTAAGCAVAVQASTGARLWAWPGPYGDQAPLDLLAGPQAVVAVVQAYPAAPAGMAMTSVVDRLVGLDPKTGTERWTLNLGGDAEDLPVMFAGDLVVVAETNGTLLGLDGATGARRWTARLPKGCRPGPFDTGSLSEVLAGLSAITVVDQCANREQLTRVDPATGASQWTLPLPNGWMYEDGDAPATVSGLIGVIVSTWEHGGSLAKARPGPKLGPQYAQDDVLVVVNAATGRARWQMKVPASSGVVGGAGQFCVVPGFALACFTAGDGTPSWQWSAPVRASDNGLPSNVVVTGAGQLAMTVPTTAAQSIPQESTTYQARPGAFQLKVFDMTQGQTLATDPLPAYYDGDDGVVVSLMSPPGVLAASGNEVYVSPQQYASDVVEAFPLP